MLTANRSATVLLYSVRLRRRAVTRPGLAAERRSTRSISDSIRAVIALSWAGAGFGEPWGGISPVRSFRRIASHVSRLRRTESGWPNGPRSTPPAFAVVLWQAVQLRAKKAATDFSKAGAAALLAGGAEGRRRAAARSGMGRTGSANRTQDRIRGVSPFRLEPSVRRVMAAYPTGGEVSMG